MPPAYSPSLPAQARSQTSFICASVTLRSNSDYKVPMGKRWRSDRTRAVSAHLIKSLGRNIDSYHRLATLPFNSVCGARSCARTSVCTPSEDLRGLPQPLQSNRPCGMCRNDTIKQLNMAESNYFSKWLRPEAISERQTQSKR